jgi:hypothetical protein
MIGYPASARVHYAAVPFLAFATFVGYGYGLEAVRWLWPFPHHSPWLYLVPDIQGIIVAVVVSVPVVLFLVRYVRAYAVLGGIICTLPILAMLIPNILDQRHHAATRAMAAVHACAFAIGLVGGAAIARSNTRWSEPHRG